MTAINSLPAKTKSLLVARKGDRSALCVSLGGGGAKIIALRLIDKYLCRKPAKQFD